MFELLIHYKSQALEKLISSYKEELDEVSSGMLRQMQNIYGKFLHSNKMRVKLWKYLTRIWVNNGCILYLFAGITDFQLFILGKYID